MNNVNFLANSFFHSNVDLVHSSQHVDAALTRNACSSIQPIIPILPTNGYTVSNLWPFSNAIDTTTQPSHGTASQENRGNEQATIAPNTQPAVYAWMQKKKRGKNGKDEESKDQGKGRSQR
jgi:hypothetical protein